MALDEGIRRMIGHQMFLDKDSVVGSKLTGMFLLCEYQGLDCNKQK